MKLREFWIYPQKSFNNETKEFDIEQIGIAKVDHGDNVQSLIMNNTEGIRVREVSPDLDAAVDKMAKTLQDTMARANAIKHQHACIGLDVTHVDFNCIYCLSEWTRLKAEEALAEFEKVIVNETP